ncbi:uncharacterized protein At3g49140 [Impatiens glandulifera]|uniref:uncharacterized protein At3g49140 n=1 Tax=Impatiens glandulifera TaxID=253017 RepID=UPI001FB19D5E|nr:uncharacterized protein At3g49140 [Impatiens glandulifera]
MTRDICLSKVSVSRDSFHPLEEVKVCKRLHDSKLTSAEMAKTVVEANSSSILIFPSTVHSEPHDYISWAEFQYFVDKYGNIFFEIFDDENILHDILACNPVNALIGMDMKIYENKRMHTAEYTNLGSDSSWDDIHFDEDYFEARHRSDIFKDFGQWGMPVDITLNEIHPIYFAKCLTKSIDVEYTRKIKNPSNGVSIIGYLKPVTIEAEEVLYLRKVVKDDPDPNLSDIITEKDPSKFIREDKKCPSVWYRLKILKLEVFSVYGVQSTVSMEDFEGAEADVLVHSALKIVKNYNERGSMCNFALAAFCKKRGLSVEGASLIGVDSLGVDVRVSYGVEVQTHRFAFKDRARNEAAAERQIRQLLLSPACMKLYADEV